MDRADGSRAATLRRDLPAELESIGLARVAVADVLAGPLDEPIDLVLVGDVQLAVSELVTNAVAHGAAPITLEVGTTDSSVTCVVTSSLGEGDPPHPERALAPGPASRSGRGLAIVRSLADTVTTTITGDTLAVRCEFRRR